MTRERHMTEDLERMLRGALVTASGDLTGPDGASREQVLAMRAGGKAIDQATRADLIQRSIAGEHIELELDIIAYAQTPGVRNRNFIRFKPGRLQAIARTGVGTVFLRDHAHWQVMSAGGTITASAMVKVGDTREIHQTVRITVPWAVQAVLQGVLVKFSMGWSPTAAVHCTLCKAPIQHCQWKLGHWRGTEHNGQIVEYEYQDAELVETSAVNVPAVPETRVREVRPTAAATAGAPLVFDGASQALDTLLALACASAEPIDNPEPIDNLERQDHLMPDTRDLARVNAALQLQIAASEDATLAAVQQLQERATRAESELGLLRAQLADLTRERDQATAERDQLRTDKAALEEQTRAAAADAFVTSAIEQGKCAANSTTAAYFRGMFLANPEAAAETLAAAPVVTPVGRTMQSGGKAPAPQPSAAPPDYARLATTLSAADRKNADRAGTSLEAYVRANYETLAVEYSWAPRA